MSSMIKFINISKSYNKAKALDDISFELEENKIYGLLGRNGAGKTTLLNILATHSFQTSGCVEVYGGRVLNNESIMSKICYIKENKDYNRNLKVKEILKLAALAYPDYDKNYEEKLINKFELDVNKTYKHLSKGMQSTAGIIIGLSSRAPITIFDEPYLGLDAYARQLFYDELIEDYTEHPRTIIVSSHLINEISNIIEKVVLLDKGKILLIEDADIIRSKAFCITGKKEAVEAFAEGRRLLGKKSIGSLISISLMDDITSEDIGKLERIGVDVASLTLQDVFIHLTNSKGADNNEQFAC